MYVCLCNCIEDEELKDTVAQCPNKTDKEIMELLGLSRGCGVCKDLCKQMISDLKEKNEKTILH
jgi:bacterioferritin-associated ferredoxin